MKWQLKALKAVMRELPTRSARPRRRATDLPGRARQVKETEAEEIIAGYRSGLNVYQLGRRFELSRQTISKILHRHGTDMRRTGLAEDQVPKAARLYDEGWTLAKLGKRFEVSPETVRLRLLSYGVRLRSRSGH